MTRDDIGADTARLPNPEEAGPGWGALSSRTSVDLGAVSRRGKGRHTNEDSFLAARFERSIYTLRTNLPPGQVPEQYNETGYVMIVADGMGGAAGGEVASWTAISALVELFIRTPDWIMRPDAGGGREVLRRMSERFGRLPEALAKRAAAEPNIAGMGTTLTLAGSLGADLFIAHVGASRAYLFRRGHLVPLTRDQTVARLLADAGVIRPDDVATHFARRELTDSITASGGKAEVELRHLRLADGDQLLLCSDGLTGPVADAKISEVLGQQSPAASACRALVELAQEAGGEDDATVLLASYRIPGGGD